jgi:hypothetical protein
MTEIDELFLPALTGQSWFHVVVEPEDKKTTKWQYEGVKPTVNDRKKAINWTHTDRKSVHVSDRDLPKKAHEVTLKVESNMIILPRMRRELAEYPDHRYQ